MIKRQIHRSVLVLSFLWVFACSPSATPPASQGTPDPTHSKPVHSAESYAYRNAVNPPPPDWRGPVFNLSRDYPSKVPAECPQSECPWLYLPVDFDSQEPRWEDGWDDYLQAILDYVKEEQSLSSQGWSVEVGGSTRWYHVPWMAFDPKHGREFVHGMTNERTTTVSDLLGGRLPESQDDTGGKGGAGFETWAFGVYNHWGGHAFGKSWDKHGEPVLEAGPPQRPAGLPFQEGTVVAKLLFTTATPRNVFYLNGSPVWWVNRHLEVGGCERSPQPVRLLQMDVAVVDERSPTRWVYGTFSFNGPLSGEVHDPWERLSPLGLQWGYDAQTFPAVPRAQSVAPTQTVLAPIDIYEHFGCERRLAGPVDNPRSSCMSCHGNGYVHLPVGSETVIFPPEQANVPPIFGFPGICTEENATNTTYFTGVSYPETWAAYPQTMSMDTSLQMLVAFQSYGTFKTKGPQTCAPPSPATN